jgi:hypothetical protein
VPTRRRHALILDGRPPTGQLKLADVAVQPPSRPQGPLVFPSQLFLGLLSPLFERPLGLLRQPEHLSRLILDPLGQPLPPSGPLISSCTWVP